jgi:putative FmdB family regulatory protein
MPIYEYQCKKCSRVFEALVLGNDDKDVPACDKCGSCEVQRRISAANTIGGTGRDVSGGCSPNSSSGFS